MRLGGEQEERAGGGEGTREEERQRKREGEGGRDKEGEVQFTCNIYMYFCLKHCMGQAG